MGAMCDVDWALVREWVGTVAEVATAIIAGIALVAWRSHLRGTTKYTVAHRIIEEAHLLRYFFYDARNPLVSSGEFPDKYHLAGGKRTSAQETEGWAHVYQERYKMVRRQVLVLARLRARAMTVMGAEVAKAIED